MKYLTENKNWVKFYPKFCTGFFLEKAGYFDERPEITTSITQLVILFLFPFLIINSIWFLFIIPLLLFGWGKLYINLPIKTGIQDCESAAWGFNYHDNIFWIYIGGGGNFEGGKKWKTIHMPWNYEWVRTSILLKDNTWVNETKGNRKDFYNDKWKEKQKSWNYDYTDKSDGEIIPTIIYVEEREWRRKWLIWTKMFNKTRRTIDIHFDKECGSKKGSWKGGVIGCSYLLNTNEEPLDCIKRMENERKFN